MKEINPRIIEQLGAKAQPAYTTAAQEIDPNEHAIHDLSKRPKKKVVKKVMDANGKPVMESDGRTPKTKTTREEVARLSLSMQDIIVTRRVAFMNLGKVKLFAEPADTGEEKAFALLNKLRENNKMAYKESEVATLLNKELQVAKLWYSTVTDTNEHWRELSKAKVDFNVQILAPSKGDTLLPVFDGQGRLVYFGRGYKRTMDIEEVFASDDLSIADKEITCLDVYSKDKVYKFEQGDGIGDGSGWLLVNTIDIPYGKIPVIYYSKPNPIWANVQPLIERLETVISNFADTNDYHASPTLVFKGATGAQAQEKGESGKAVLLTGDHADAKYVTWDQSVSAVKLEIDTLVNFIYSLTQTPDISFESMKNLGAKTGVAFDRVFMDPHLAARKEIEGGYGELIQRDINLQKSLLASMDTAIRPAMQSLSVTFEVPHFKLEDVDSDVDLAIRAKDGGLVSQETAIGISGLVTNVQNEIQKILNESKTMK